ncbi:MAG TPA: metallophosphoesterase [Kofleriaceae bacterium]|nr:metallophosphoesterase [Kofleriaceae bacterium]
MKRRLGALIAAALAAPAVARAETHWVKGPYIQDAAPTSITILFETGESAPGKVVVTGPDGDHEVTASDTQRHEVVVDGLRPATRYRYKVTVAGATQSGELTTAPEPGTDAPLTFVVYGDTREYAESHRRVMERIRNEVPDFLLGTGDMVDEGSKGEQWQTFFDIEGPLLRDNVLYPALGNHDRQGRGRTADTYRAFFAVPENSPDPERYYAFTYGASRFFILDSNSYSFALTDQTAWLEKELAAARDDRRVRHLFVVMHHPPYSISLHGGQRDLRERWTPLFEKYGVAAVFSGHDHVYERAEVGGVHYFVSGGGGAPLYPKKAHSAQIDLDAVKYFERVNHYLRVHIVGDQLEVTAVRVDGTPIETTTWSDTRGEPAVAAAGGPAASADSGAALAPPPAPPPSTPAIAASTPAEDGGRSSIGWTVAAGALLVLGALAALWRALRS